MQRNKRKKLERNFQLPQKPDEANIKIQHKKNHKKVK